jgi:hypothetical protein
MGRYHRERNPNGLYGKCSNRKLTDFCYGDSVVITLSADQNSIGMNATVIGLYTREQLLIRINGLDWTIEPKRIEFTRRFDA